MAKYSLKFKYKIVQEYLGGGIGCPALAKKYNILSHRNIHTWVKAYETLGIDGLKRSRKNNNYTLDFKLEVVELYLKNEMSYQALANELKINNPSIIARWVKEFREQGIEGLKNKKRGRPSSMDSKKGKNTKVKKEYSPEELDRIKQLEKENYWLRLENDFIKKKIELRERAKQKKKK